MLAHLGDLRHECIHNARILCLAPHLQDTVNGTGRGYTLGRAKEVSDLLGCDITIHALHSPSYWWPLIFEAMHQAGFEFVNPGESGGMGTFFDHSHAEAELDAVQVRSTFRGFWDRAYGDERGLVVVFWSPHVDPIEVWVSLQFDHDNTNTSFHLTLPVESLDDDLGNAYPEGELVQRLRYWLESICAVYALCGPGEAEIFWEKDDWLVGCIGKPSTLIGPVRPGSVIRTRSMPDGRVLSWLDPFPVPNRGEYVWVHLGDSAQSEVASS